MNVCHEVALPIQSIVGISFGQVMRKCSQAEGGTYLLLPEEICAPTKKKKKRETRPQCATEQHHRWRPPSVQGRAHVGAGAGSPHA